MRTVSFQSVYESVARRHGLDPMGDAIHIDTGRQIAEKVTDRALIAWQSWDFAELTRTEERAFRPVWNNTDQYLRVGEEGLPDEVFYLVNTKYYRVKTTAPSDPTAGTLPTNTTYFQEITPEPYIASDQRCRRSIGQVLGVYSGDPSFNTQAGIDLALPFRPSEHGIRVMGAYGATVFVWYMLPSPEYTITPFITGKTYHRGDRVFYGKPVGDGNCYRALATTTNVPTSAASWSMEPVPVSLRKYLEAGAYSDCLRDTIFNGVDEPTRALRMQAAAGEAETHITRLIDNLIGQGQKHFYGGSRWWKYSGNGMWSSQPWGGDRVWTLTDACDDNTLYPPLPPPIPLPGDTQSGVTPLVNGQDYVDVVFGTAQPSDSWVFFEARILNTTDLTPLNIWPGIVTIKTAAGFRLQLNGTPDSDNYYLSWSIQGVFGYYLTGPTSGKLGVASAAFTVRLPTATSLVGTAVITPSDGGAGGTFTPSTVALTAAAPSAAFTYTPSSYGARSISTTNDRGLANPAQIGFTSTAASYTLSGPSSGFVGVASTNFTVALPVGGAVAGTLTVTPSDGGGGGTFTPPTVGLTTAAPSATFTYTPTSTGAKTISVTNNGSLTNPANITYTATAAFLDEFVGTGLLSSHTADTGQTWQRFVTGASVFNKISSGSCYNDNGTDDSYSSFTPAAADAEASLTIIKAAITGSPEFGLWLRATADATNPRGYMGRFVEGTGYQFYRLDAGITYVQIGSNVAGSMADGDTLKFTVAGSGATVTLTLYKNGVSVATAGDSACGRITTNGKVGIHLYDPTSGTGNYRLARMSSPV